MSISTISTFGSLQTLLQNINDVQGSLNNDQVQISSGQVSQTFDGLDGSIEQFTSLSAQVSRLQNYQNTNGIVLSQLQTSNTVLGQIQQLATSLKSLVAAQQSGTASTASFQQQLQSGLATLTAQLNTTFSGSYIFGGTSTNTPPIMTPVPHSIQEGVADASYYQGSSQNSISRVGDGQEIINNIRADNTAFQQIFAGISQALQAASSGNAVSSLQNAETLIDNGLQGVIGLQASVNANIVNVQGINGQSQTLQAYFQSLTQAISKSDVVALSAKVAQDQTVLQASFSVFARISSLTLSNYLK